MTFPKYPAYKDSGVEWLGEVPEHWAVCKLNFRYSVELGKMLDEKRITNTSPLPYLRNQDVQWGKINTDDLPEMDIHPVEHERYTVRNGDLLVCEGGDVGRAAIWRGEDAVLGYQKALHRLRHRCVHADTAEFFYFGLLAAKLRGVFEESESKSTIAHLPAEKFRQYFFAFPPLPEQLAIAAHLDHETARIDALIGEQQRLIELLKKKRQAVISHAVTKGLDPSVPMKDSGVEWLGEVPEHWGVARVKNVAKLESGHTPSKEFPEYWEGGDIPWISLNDSKQLKAVDYITDTQFMITAEGVRNSSARLLPERAVVFTRDASIGLAAITTRKMCVSQHLIAWICDETLITPEYLLLAFYAMEKELDRFTFGATIKTIGMPDVRKLMTTIPPLEEQKNIVAEVSQKRELIERLIREANNALDLHSERRSALISAAVTGKIDLRGWQPPAGTPAPIREEETA